MADEISTPEEQTAPAQETTAPAESYPLTPLEQMQADLANSLEEYHTKATAGTLTLAEVDAYNKTHNDLRAQICDAFSEGAIPKPGWQKPRGMQKNPTTVEVYAFDEPIIDNEGNTVVRGGTRYLYARGLTVEQAVFNWNRGKVEEKQLIA